MYDTYLYCYRLRYVHSYLLQVYLTQLSIFSATLVYLNVISSTFIYLLIYPYSSVCIQLTIRGPPPRPLAFAYTKYQENRNRNQLLET